MTERTVNVKARLTYAEYVAGANRVGQSTRQMKRELQQLATAEAKAAAEAKKSAETTAAAAREKSRLARTATAEARAAAATARQLDTAEARSAAEAASARATAAKQAASSAHQEAAAAKELERATTSSAAAAARDARETAAASRSHDQAVQTTARHAAVVGTVLVGAFAAAGHATLDFDKQISAVRAASGATAGEMQQLRDAAIQAGQATVFGATDAARAEEELSKASVSVKDILAGALSGALNLATAGNLDLGQAAEIAASAMTQFKLKGADVPHIADLLAAGAGKAQGSVSDLGVALKYVGPIAGQMGISIEETTGTLAELASNGILADQAGTSLRGILSSLTSPSVKAAAAMDELGIQVYDASGNFVGFGGAAQQLHEKLGGLTNAQRDQTLGLIFGNDQLTAARILYAGGADEVNHWTKQVNDSGYAARFAAQRMDNLAGDLEQLKGSLETALIKSGSGATTVLRGMTQAATGAVNAFSGWPTAAQTAVAASSAISGSIVLIGAGVGTIVPKIRTAREELIATGRAGEVAAKSLGWLGRLGAYAAGVAAAAEAVHVLSGRLGDLGSKGLFGQPDLSGGPSITDNVQQQFSQLTDLWDRLRFSSSDAGFDASGMDQQLTRIAAKAEDGTNTFQQLAEAIARCGENTEDAKSSIKNLDADLAHLKGSDPKAAALVMDQIAAAMRQQGLSAKTIKDLFPQYNKALGDAGINARIAGQAIDGYAASTDDANTEQAAYIALVKDSKLSTDGLSDAMNGLKDAVSEASDEYDYFIGRNVDLVTSEARMKQGMADAADAIRKNGRSLDDNTEAGRKNIAALGDLFGQAEQVREKMIGQGSSVDAANAAFWRQVDAIRNLGIKAHISEHDMDVLLGKMLGVASTKVKPTIDANIKAALDKIAELKRQLAYLQHRELVWELNYVIKNKPRGGADAIPQAGARGGIAGKTLQPWTDSRDVIPAMLRPGEAVITPEARKAAGLTDAAVAALNAGRVPLTVGAGAAPLGAAVGKGTGSAMTVTLDPADRALLRAVADAAGRPLTGTLQLERRGSEVMARIVRDGEQRLRGI